MRSTRRHISIFYGFLLIAVMAILFAGCHQNEKKKSTGHSISEWKNQIQYARGFALFREGAKTKVIVYSPWEKGTVLDSFVLVKHPPAKGEIQVPLNRVAVFSVTQLNALQKLGLLDAVVGVSDVKYIKNEEIQKRYARHQIAQLAVEGNFFVEKILETHPQAMFYSPYQGSASLSPALSSIQAIPFLDFMEANPLGRAEWIKFTAAFFGKEKTADSIFNHISKAYLKLKKLADTVKYRPTVLSDKFYDGQWYVPGGDSYIATLFRDAGADYVWKNVRKQGSFPLDFESVYKKAGHADFWRILGSYGEKASYPALANENKLYTKFKAFRLHHIIYCKAESGYFEKGSLEPQVLLADFIKAFHPELLPHYKPHYYKILK
ncbi:MAG: ABC transporter substrate-binding protein [Bacteroidales bacterium]|nr:ABC transporter substrate-binding protein [Bacteroidales bacterium]